MGELRLNELNAEVEPLPPGTFKESGTMVNTVLLTIDKGLEQRRLTSENRSLRRT